MKLLPTLVLPALVACSLVATDARAQIPGAHFSQLPPTNEHGAFVRLPSGAPINYTQAELAAQLAANSGAEFHPPAAGPEGGPIGNPVAIASFASFGQLVGVAGICTAQVNGLTEVYVGGSTAYWYSVVHNPATAAYDMNWVSPPYPSNILRIQVGDCRSEPGDEIVVLLASGTVEVRSASTKQSLHNFSSGVSSPAALRLFDHDGDGDLEIFVANSNSVSAFSGTGAPVWSKTGMGGTDLAVAQMDGDPSLELATTDGKVVDMASGTIQCSWAAGFGYLLRSADFDGDGMQELIFAEHWNFCWAFDVDTCLPKWSMPVFNVGAIEVADVDGDGTEELIVGDAQWGDIHAHVLSTQAQLWSIANPEHGTTWIAVEDVDADGQNEVLWGAGASSSGSDRLYVGNYVAQSIEWENVQLDGPFIGPVVGDVDGDGDLEVVSASNSSDAGYGAGCIVVLDAESLAVEAISQETMHGLGWEGLHDLRLRNIDADPQLEIVLAGGTTYDGLIEIYDYSASGTFSLAWDNNTLPFGAVFHCADVADLDDDGTLEVFGGVGRSHTGALGNFVYVYDLATGAEEWHSLQMGAYWGRIDDVAAANTDGTGARELLGMVEGGEIYVYDGSTKALEAIIPGAFRAIDVPPFGGSGPPQIWAGTNGGSLASYAFNGASYVGRGSYPLLGGPIEGFSFGRMGSVYVAGGGTVKLVYPPASGHNVWTLSGLGNAAGLHIGRVKSVPSIVLSNSFAITAYTEF